eukprot:scaffold49320_cov34-Phaeocystis_antarctica.AAC.1
MARWSARQIVARTLALALPLPPALHLTLTLTYTPTPTPNQVSSAEWWVPSPTMLQKIDETVTHAHDLKVMH